MALPPRSQRPAAVGISKRVLKSGTRYTLRVTDPETGQRLNFGEFDERWQAEARALQAFEDYRAGRGLKPGSGASTSLGDMPLGQFIDEVYLPSLDVEESTTADYRLACEHIRKWKCGKDANGKPLHFGDKPIGEITHGDVKRFITAFRKGGRRRRSDNYTRKVAQRLRHILNIAVAEGYIATAAHPYRHDGTKDNKLPGRSIVKNECSLSHEAVEKMLGILKRERGQATQWGREAGFWYMFVNTATWSGLRISELMGLQFDDLRHDTSTVRVDAQWAWNSRAAVAADRFADPKSKYGYRSVPLPDDVFLELWEWADTVRKESSPDELVFPRPAPGGGWAYWGSSPHFHRKYKSMQDTVWDLYEKDAAKYHWEHKYTRSQMMQPPHELRHLWVSICIAELNLDLNSVSRWAGHHSPAFTAEVYAGLLQEVHDEAAKKVRAVRRSTQVAIF